MTQPYSFTYTAATWHAKASAAKRLRSNGLLVRLPVRFGDEFEQRVFGNSVVEGGPRSAPVQESGLASMTTRLAAVTRPNFSPAAPTLPRPDFWPRINSREACPGRAH